MRRLMTICAVALVAVAATPAMGGWVVTTVEDLPAYLVAGQATPLTFTIRQHGAERMRGRAPTVRVRAVNASFFNRGERFRAAPAGPAEPGTYRATLVVPDAGMFAITIDADFNGQQTELLPMRVLAPGSTPVAQSGVDRGRDLFVGKGCYSCHVVEDDPEVYERNRAHIGPDLTGRQFPVEYLTAKLSDPRTAPATVATREVMPDLDLSAAEIGALIAYLNRPRATAMRR